LKRAIQREIETPLARKIVGGEIRDGETVFIDADTTGSGLAFRLESNETAPAGAARV
jgi:ATP-dependent Clp protease ATP-binding subunit ClpB